MESSTSRISFGNGKEKILAIVLAVVGLLATGFIISTIILGVKYNYKADIKDQSVADRLKNDTSINETLHICNTEECTKAAGDILKAMDRNVNPCDDFFQFTCGNWIKNNPIPEHESLWDQFLILPGQIHRKIKEILETKVRKSEPIPVKHAKFFYKRCLDQNRTDQTELKELLETVLKVGDISRNIGLKLGELRRRTEGQYLVTLEVELDEKNTSNYIIYLDQPSFGLDRAFLTSNDNVDHINKILYTELIATVWPLVYPDDISMDHEILAKNIVTFEAKIANISNENETDIYNTLSLGQLGDSTSNMINWEVYIMEVFKDVIQNYNVDLGDLSNLTVAVRDLKYFKDFGLALKLAMEEDPAILANYLRWRIIVTYGNDISLTLQKIFFEYTKKTQGVRYPAARWEVCSFRTNEAFGMAISYPYVQEAFSSNFSSEISEIMGNIQSSMLGIIDKADWIGSDNIRSKAKERVRSMISFIGFPNWLLTNKTALDAYYHGLEFNASATYFESYFQISKWKNMESLRNFKKPRDYSKWFTDPTFVGAFYSAIHNSITIPAGYLQSPFYFTGIPIQALNYGAIATVIGHEISHGLHYIISDKFSQEQEPQSNVNGSLVEWWDKKGTTIQYFIKADCFIKQYSQFKASEDSNLMVNGLNTVGENIADNAGLHQSFQAYQLYVKKHGPEPKLPGLKYTPHQLFFIAFSQTFCGSYTPQGMESQILNDVHCPNHFRVKGVLENSLDFAKTWNCPSPDPKKVCSLW